MFFRSIRFKIMLWYMLFLMLTLLFFSSILYGSFTKALYNDLDDLLSSRADGISNSIGAYWSARGTSLSGNGPDSGELAKNIDNWITEKRKDPELMSIFSQVLDRYGKCLAAPKSMPRIKALSEDVLEDALDGEDDFDIVKGQAADGKTLKFRVYTKPVAVNGTVEYIVQVTGPLGLLTLAARNLMWLLFALLPLTVILAALPGVLLVTLTLRPVDTMINTLKQTTAENLKLRIHIPDTKDEIKRLAETFNDMTERLDRSFSSQQGFIQNISDDIKAPLGSLKEKFRSASRSALSWEEYDLLLRSTLEELETLEKAIGSLENLARFDNRTAALEIRKVDLPRLLEEALTGIKAQADRKEITVSSFLQEAIVIDGDEKQLKKMFLNILDNAVKYTYCKGEVTVSAHRDKRSAAVRISDTGAGIEQDEISYIFDRFYRAGKHRRFGDAGFGMGLSVARSIVESHKGKILVESHVGKGSTFTVILPVSYPG